jgi:Raf kinase inhibitor-like YbhB/YbcL family protein
MEETMDVIHGVKLAVGHALRSVHAGSAKLASREVQPRLAASLFVASPAFCANGAIPPKHSAQGENVSPALYWSDVPQETKELLLICEDPDAPRAKPFVHWTLYGLSPELTGLPEGVPAMDLLASIDNARQGKNSAGQIGYAGPMPPVGHGVHHYHFQLFALDTSLRFEHQLDRDDLIAAMSGHVLASGEMIGTYQRE